MPPHRRRPAPNAGQAPPIRRPRVAGLRNRPDQQADEPSDRIDDVSTETEATETTVLPRVEIDPETNEPPAIRDDEEPADASDAVAEPAVAEPAVADDDVADATEAKPRPQVRTVARPAGKRRATGTARPEDLSAAETDAGSRQARHAKAEAKPTRSRAQTQISLAIILAVVAIILAGLAVFFRGKANDLNSGDTNTALTDTATTSQIKGQLTTAIKQTFSYNYTDLGSTEKAVKENLTGKALCEYNLLFGEVKQYAPEQKIVLDTTVRELAVVRIDGDRAEALVYIDQLSTRVDVNKTVAVGGQFAVQAHRQGDQWKITEFDMFGQPLFNGKPAPTC